MIRRKFLKALLGAATGVMAVSPVLARGFESLFAPKAKLWPRWTAHDPASTASVDHRPWEAFLERYLVRDRAGINRVAYGAVGIAERQALDAYIAGLAALPISRFSRDQQLAYWINLYNALTVKVVLSYYPVASIRDIKISPGLFSSGPWDKKLLSVEGEEISLNDIEHRILRPIWRDPRIHYAVNCASIGCPNLQRAAYLPETVDDALERAAREYVNHPRGARLADGKLYVSSLYSWFEDDFGGFPTGVIAHLMRYAEPHSQAQLARITTIAGDDYDWALNDAATA